MSEHKLHIEQGGFINKEKLFAYLRNELSDTEKMRIEKLMAHDPFLQDAVEGLKGADLNTIENVLSSIFEKIDATTTVQKTNTFSANIRKYAAAASIVLFLGMSWVIIDNLNNKQKDANEIAVEPTIIKADKNSEAFTRDDSSDMGSGSAAADSISMDELTEETVYFSRSKEVLIEPEKIGESNYNFDYTDDAKSEITISTEMIITPPVMMDENSNLSSTTSKEAEMDAIDNVVTAGTLATESVTLEDKNLDLDKDYALSEKKDKKIKNNAAKSEPTDELIETNKAPASVDTLAPVFAAVEQMPAYPGGTDALNLFILNNLNSDCVGDKDCKEGNVFVKFIVNEDGSISAKQIIKTVNPALDEEILRVISIMPKWIPGEQNKVKVKVWYTLKVKIDYE